jgi:excinuclease ABC subunit C
LEQLGIINQPLAAIAKREELIYVLGQEDDPVRLDRFSPLLHLVQQIRDEAHRFAVTFHRQRRDSKALTSALMEVPGVGEKTVRKLLKTFGSLDQVRHKTTQELAAVVNRTQAARIQEFFGQQGAPAPEPEPAPVPVET